MNSHNKEGVVANPLVILREEFDNLTILRGGGGCLDRIQVFISGKLPLVHDHAAACLCDCVPK